MKYDTQSIAIASVVAYLTVQVSGLVYALCLVAGDIGLSDASDVAMFAGIGFVVTAVPTLVFATLLGTCTRLLARYQSRLWTLYLIAPVLGILIWITVNTLLEQSLRQGVSDLAYGLLLIMPPAVLGAGAMHFALWKRTREAQQGCSTLSAGAAEA